MNKLIFFVTLFYLFSFNAYAFEIKGFKDGMTLEEVTTKIHSQNWDMKKFGEDSYEIKNMLGVRELTLAFCENILSQAHIDYDDKSPHTFSKLVLDYERSGLKIVKTKIYEVREDVEADWHIVSTSLESNTSNDQVSIHLMTSNEGEIFYKIIYSNSSHC